VTGFHYPSTRAVNYGPSTRVVETGLKRRSLSNRRSSRPCLRRFL